MSITQALSGMVLRRPIGCSAISGLAAKGPRALSTPTRMRSNSTDCSTLTNSASHALMSSSFFAGLSSTFLFALT